MDILMMGGTRFVGRPLVGHFLRAGHSVTLFTRGKQPLPDGVEHLKGDRSEPDGLAALAGAAVSVFCAHRSRSCRMRLAVAAADATMRALSACLRLRLDVRFRSAARRAFLSRSAAISCSTTLMR